MPVELGAITQSQLSARDDKVRSGDVGVRLVPHARRDEEGVGEADTGAREPTKVADFVPSGFVYCQSMFSTLVARAPEGIMTTR